MKKLLLTLAAILATSVCFAQDSIQLKRSDELFANGVELYKQGKYIEAIPLFTEADAIDKALRDTLDGMRYYSEVWLASCYYKTGDEDKAKKTHDYYKLEPVDGREVADLEERLFVISSIQDLVECLRVSEECLGILVDRIGKSNYKYLELLENVCYYKFYNDVDSEKEYAEINTYLIDGKYNETGIYILYKILTFEKYIKAGDVKQAKKILSETKKIKKTTAMQYEYTNMLFVACNTMLSVHDLPSLKDYALEAIDFIEENDLSGTCLFEKFYWFLAFYHNFSSSPDYSKAAECAEKAISMLEKNDKYKLDECVDIYAELCNLAVFIYYNMNDVKKMTYYADKYIPIAKPNPELHENLKYCCKIVLNKSADIQPISAVEYCKCIMEILESENVRDFEYYFYSSLLAEFYNNAGYSDKALTTATENLESSRDILGENSLAYAVLLTKYAEILFNNNSPINQHPELKAEIIGYVDSALKIIKSVNVSPDEKDIADNCQATAKFIKSSLENMNDSGLITKASKCDDAYLTNMSKLFYSFSNGEYKKAQKQLHYLSEEYEKINGEQASNLIFYPMEVFCYMGLNNNNAASEYVKKYVSELKQYVDNELLYMTPSTRMKKWERNTTSVGAIYLSNTISHTFSEDISGASYDLALISKGMSLSADVNIKNVIMNCGNQDVIFEYYKILKNRELRDNQMLLNPKERKINIDSLNVEINLQEESLMKILKELNYDVEREDVTWRDVRDALGENDIAVEFVKYADWYMAFYVTKSNGIGWNTLFNEEQFYSLKKDSYYTDDELYKMVWKPLMLTLIDGRYLPKSYDNIYFSADGILNQIAIENAPYKLDSTFYYPSNMHRLSSTRELVHKNGRANLNKTVLYGGIEYEADGPTIIAANAKKAVKTTKTSDGIQNMIAYESGSRSVTDSLDVRGEMRFLQGTLEEVEAISNTLNSSSTDTVTYKTDVYTDVYATEESFRNLSGTDVTALHIATHGFFFTQTEAERQKENEKAMQFVVDDDNVAYEDKAMTRSGLMLAGAASSLRGDLSMVQVEDGILTAMEISQLDLRNVDMVVLSACETGLGDISADGVFGLQRGFKKAGVKTIVMSLWKVDDEATRIFMDTFYRQLANGESKREAFNVAQYILRHDSNGKYSDPKYWAAFIMLD